MKRKRVKSIVEQESYHDAHKAITKTLGWKCNCTKDCSGFWGRHAVYNARQALHRKSKKDQLLWIYDVMKMVYDRNAKRYTFRIGGILNFLQNIKKYFRRANMPICFPTILCYHRVYILYDP